MNCFCSFIVFAFLVSSVYLDIHVVWSCVSCSLMPLKDNSLICEGVRKHFLTKVSDSRPGASSSQGRVSVIREPDYRLAETVLDFLFTGCCMIKPELILMLEREFGSWMAPDTSVWNLPGQSVCTG